MFRRPQSVESTAAVADLQDLIDSLAELNKMAEEYNSAVAAITAGIPVRRAK